MKYFVFLTGLLLSQALLANLGLTIISPRPIGKLLCSHVFQLETKKFPDYLSIESAQSHYVSSHLNFVFAPDFRVVQLTASHNKSYWPYTQKVDPVNFERLARSQSFNWSDKVTTDETNARILEWGSENPIFQHVNREHLGFWQQSVQRLQRQRKGFNWDAYRKVVERLPPERTHLYSFGVPGADLIFRLYDSSIHLKTADGSWGQKKSAKEKSLAEWKYYEKIPAFKDLLSKYDNIIAVEGFAASKDWLHPQKAVYHEVAKYIDSNYNENLYRLISNFQILRQSPAVVISIVPRGLAKHIHKGLDFEYLKDSKGKIIRTEDGYEIIYLKAEKLVEKHLKKTELPVLKSDEAGQRHLQNLQSFEKAFQEYFRIAIEDLKQHSFKSENLWPEIMKIREKNHKLKMQESSLNFMHREGSLSKKERQQLAQLKRQIWELEFLEYRMLFVTIYKGNQYRLPTDSSSLNDFTYMLSQLYSLFKEYYIAELKGH